MPPVRSMLMSTGRFPSGYVGVPGVSPDGMPISPRLSDGEGFVCGLLPWPQPAIPSIATTTRTGTMTLPITRFICAYPQRLFRAFSWYDAAGLPGVPTFRRTPCLLRTVAIRPHCAGDRNAGAVAARPSSGRRPGGGGPRRRRPGGAVDPTPPALPRPGAPGRGPQRRRRPRRLGNRRGTGTAGRLVPRRRVRTAPRRQRRGERGAGVLGAAAPRHGTREDRRGGPVGEAHRAPRPATRRPQRRTALRRGPQRARRRHRGVPALRAPDPDGVRPHARPRVPGRPDRRTAAAARAAVAVPRTGAAGGVGDPGAREPDPGTRRPVNLNVSGGGGRPR